MNAKEITYALIKKDGTVVNIKGHFLKYDAGNVMVIHTTGEKNTVVAVVNMEACVALVDAVGLAEQPKTT